MPINKGDHGTHTAGGTLEGGSDFLKVVKRSQIKNLEALGCGYPVETLTSEIQLTEEPGDTFLALPTSKQMCGDTGDVPSGLTGDVPRDLMRGMCEAVARSLTCHLEFDFSPSPVLFYDHLFSWEPRFTKEDNQDVCMFLHDDWFGVIYCLIFLNS